MTDTKALIERKLAEGYIDSRVRNPADGEKVYIGSPTRDGTWWEATGIFRKYECVDTGQDQSVFNVIHYNGNVLQHGFYAPYWRPLSCDRLEAQTSDDLVEVVARALQPKDPVAAVAMSTPDGLNASASAVLSALSTRLIPEGQVCVPVEVKQRHDFLIQSCSYHYPEGHNPPSPREFGIMWEYQDNTTARPSLEVALDRDVAEWLTNRSEDEDD